MCQLLVILQFLGAGGEFGGRGVSSFLFADNVILFASSSNDFQLRMERLTAKCEDIGMRINTFMSEAFCVFLDTWF